MANRGVQYELGSSGSTETKIVNISEENCKGIAILEKKYKNLVIAYIVISVYGLVTVHGDFSGFEGYFYANIPAEYSSYGGRVSRCRFDITTNSLIFNTELNNYYDINIASAYTLGGH